MSTDDHNVLSLLGEQAKTTKQDTAHHTRLAQLCNYLRGLHSLALSEKGRTHVCQRFNVSEEELTTAMMEQEQRLGQSAPNLMHITTKAMSGPVDARGGAATC